MTVTNKQRDLVSALADLARTEEAALGSPPDPELAGVQAAIPPLGAERLDAIAAAVRARNQPVTQGAPTPTAMDDLARQRNKRSRRPFVAAASVSLAAAAAVGLFAVTIGPGPGQLPEYDVTVAGSQADIRAAAPAGEITRLTPDGELDIVLRPAEEFAEPLSAAAYLVDRGGAVHELRAPIEVSAAGSARLGGHVSALFPRGITGRATVLVVLYRRGSRQSPEWIGGRQASGPGWRRLEIPVEITADRR